MGWHFEQLNYHRELAFPSCILLAVGVQQERRDYNDCNEHHDELKGYQDPIVKRYAHLCSSVEGELIFARLALRTCKKDRHKACEKHRYDIKHCDERSSTLPSKLSMPDYWNLGQHDSINI
ncbi:hypothetical protein LSAT2_004453 [Lamellibrachia satsuma]|nr:hypothetical protein LSAT2_004453 [Lamellibrachia satsuma]